MIFTGDIAQPYSCASSFSIPEELKLKYWLGNLEGSLVDGIDNIDCKRGVYNDLVAITELCKSIPFKAFTVANNHLFDAADLDITYANAKRIDIQVFGAGRAQQASLPLLFTDHDGNTYRILAFGWENNSCIKATNSKQGVNPYTRRNVLKCVNDALSYHEPVICFMHWGYELEAYPLPFDRQLAMDLIDLGVFAVIGCHSHKIQPIELYKGKPIVYGLGNFLFHQGHYMGGKLRFPMDCKEEYAFEITKNGYFLHSFYYNQIENKLEYQNNVRIKEGKMFGGKAEFTGMTAKEYEKWFKAHRIQRKFLPIFRTHESVFSYALKSQWVQLRAGLICLLSLLNLKSANRADR